MRRVRTLLLGALTSGLMPAIVTPALASEAWTEIAHIQVLEGPEKIWVFVEVVRITSFDGNVLAHLMSARPRKELVSQTAFTIDPRGKTTEQVVSSKTGPTFHPIGGRIFRLSDGFYLYAFPSADRPASLYRWSGDQFERLTGDESDGVRMAIVPFERLEPLARVIDGLDGLTAKDGWRCTADDAVAFSDDTQPFVSSKHHVRISVETGKEPAEACRASAVVAESSSKAEPWRKTLIKVDTRSERRRHESRRTTSKRAS
jgi:hypothetical protein